MLPKFQNSFAPDKNLQTLIESFNQSQKNPNAIPRARYQQMPYMPPGRAAGGQPHILNVLQERVQLSLQPNSAINTVVANEQQDVVLKLQMNQKVISIVTIDRPLRDQKEDEQQLSSYITPYQTYKQKIEFRLEDADDVEVNGSEGTITILTKSQIKQQKNEQNKKPIQNVHAEILNKTEAQVVQIQLKFIKDWHTKISTNPQNAKKALQEFFKSFQLQKLKLTAFENQPQVEPPVAATDKQQFNQFKKQEDEVREPDPPPISDKDLQYLFPPVTEEFVQRQKEALERKNSSVEEKIKRLFEEVRIKQFKQQPYNNADRNAYKCPYHKCQKGYKRPNQLKTHLKNNHQKLQEIGLTIDDNGEFQYNEKMLDYSLLLWKVYPNFVKQVINEMKQRKEQPST